MRRKQLILCFLAIAVSLCFTGCFEEKNSYSKQGVCVVDNTSLRKEPSTKGQWISSLSLGETVRIEGNPIKDEADPKVEYIKIKLSDGSSAYASTACIVRGAYAGVIQSTVKIYKRPDLLAETNQQFELMDIVAVEEEKDDWIRVTGEGRVKSGWILKRSIRKDNEDIVTAVLLRKALRGKGTNLPREEMEAIVAELPYRENYFINKIMERYDDEPVFRAYDQEEPVASDGASLPEN